MKSGVESTGLNFIDKAFNNAGIPGDNRELVDQTEENFDRVFAVNLKALFLLLQDELKQMIVLPRWVGGSQSRLRAITWPARWRLLAGLETSRLTLPVVRKDDSLGDLFGGL